MKQQLTGWAPQSQMANAPSQRNNPHLTRFFSCLGVDELVALVLAVFRQGYKGHSIEVQLIKPSSTSTGTLRKRILFRTLDRRREVLYGAVDVSASRMQTLEQEMGDGMEVDGEEWTEGLDVVMSKKNAGNPMEMKLLWRQVLEGMPEGAIFSA